MSGISHHHISLGVQYSLGTSNKMFVDDFDSTIVNICWPIIECCESGFGRSEHVVPPWPGSTTHYVSNKSTIDIGMLLVYRVIGIPICCITFTDMLHTIYNTERNILFFVEELYPPMVSNRNFIGVLLALGSGCGNWYLLRRCQTILIDECLISLRCIITTIWRSTFYGYVQSIRFPEKYDMESILVKSHRRSEASTAPWRRCAPNAPDSTKTPSRSARAPRGTQTARRPSRASRAARPSRGRRGRCEEVMESIPGFLGSLSR